MFSELMMMEKKDACYYKVKASAKVWPSAYASGRLVQCRKKGAANYGNKSEGKINEFAPPGDDDRGPNDEEILRRLAAQWWSGTEQQMIKAQQTLEALGWEIGPDESGNNDAGVYVYRIGDNDGRDTLAFGHSELSLAEGEVTKTKTGIVHKATDKYGAGDDESQYNTGGRSGFPAPGKYARDLEHVNKQLVKDLDASMGITWKNRGTKGVEVDEGVAEGLPQTLRKVVPGYAKREIDKKMDAEKFGKTDVDRDANFQRYKKIQDKLKEQGVAEGMFGSKQSPALPVVNKIASIAGKLTPQNVNVGRQIIQSHAAELSRMLSPQAKTGVDVIEDYNAEYDDEAGMADNNLETLRRAVDGLDDLISAGDNLPEWCQEKIAVAKSMLVSVWDYMYSEEASDEEDPEIAEMYESLESLAEELSARTNVDIESVWGTLEALDDRKLYETAAWRRKEGKSKTGGLNAKGVASYRRENPGSKLQTAVTTKPSKLKPGSKAAKRRKSFCARMSGVKGPMKKPNGKPTRKALALRKWNC
jgi:hypothetical protein